MEAPFGQVKHTVHVRQDRVDLVRHEDDCAAALHGLAVNHFADRLLVIQVKRQQGLVAQQDPRVAGQCLGGAQALLLASGEIGYRAVGVAAGANELQQFVDLVAHSPAAHADPGLGAIHPQRHQVAGAQRNVVPEGALLRNQADGSRSPAHRFPRDRDAAVIQRGGAEHRVDEAGLARAVGPQNCKELPRRDGQVELFPEHARAVGKARVFESDDGGVSH